MLFQSTSLTLSLSKRWTRQSDGSKATDPTVTKSGDSDGGDNCNFYGLNAGVLVKGGSTTTITGGTITTDADGANGVFSYGGNGGQNGADGDGTTVVIRDTKIVTTGNGSGGIMTTGGRITNANGDTVSTEVGTVSVTLDDTSTWILTGDSYVTEFNGDAANVISNGCTLYVNGEALTGTN